MSRTWFALVMACVVAAGCMGDATTDSGSEDALSARGKGGADCAHALNVSCGPAASGLSVLANVTGADCEVVGATFLATRQVFDPPYPPGVSGFHSTFSSIYLGLITCAEVVYGQTVGHDWQFFWLGTLIDPPEGGDGDVPNMFVHQAYTNDPLYAQHAKQDFGLNPVVMDGAHVDFTSLPHGQQVQITVPATDPAYELVGFVDLQGNLQAQERIAYVFAGDYGLAQFMLGYAGDGSNTASPATISYNDGSYWREYSAIPQTHATTIHDFGLSMIQSYRLIKS